MVPITAGGVVLAYNLPGFEGELETFSKGLRRHFPWGDHELEGQADRRVKSWRQASGPYHYDGRTARREWHDLRIYESPGRDQRQMARPVRRCNPGRLAWDGDARARQ